MSSDVSAHYGGTRGWGAAVIDPMGACAAAVVKERDDGLYVLTWGPSGRDLLDHALEEWHRLGRPGLEQLQIDVTFSGGSAAISHTWR